LNAETTPAKLRIHTALKITPTGERIPQTVNRQ
jgi:hypothetical protein